MKRNERQFASFVSPPAAKDEAAPASSEAPRAQNARGNHSLLFALLVSMVMMICSVVWQHGGVLYPEVESRLPYYLSHGSLLSKLYDSDYLDMGMYQARELSYFFDYIDCKFIACCVALGHPHFLSLTQYVFLVLISLVLWRFGVGELKLERWIGLCVLLLYWTTPAVFLGGAFYRTAKIGVALAVVVLYWRIFRILRAARDIPRCGLSARSWLVCFGWAWAATLFDRLGVFMVGVIVVFLGFWFFAYREKSVLKLTGAFVAALALSIIYNEIIAPLLTVSISHYWPDFKYQHLPWGDLTGRPVFFITSAFSLYFDAVRFFIGNIPQWGAALVVIGLVYLALVTGGGRQESKPFFRAAQGLFLSQTVLIWVMILLMVLRHGTLLWPNERRLYYFLPVVSMFSMTLLLVLSRLQTRRMLPGRCLALLLGGALLGNAIALPRHDANIRAGLLMESLSDCYQSTPVLLDALRNLRNPRYLVSPAIALNRVFQFFHDGHFSKTPAILPRDKNKTTREKAGTKDRKSRISGHAEIEGSVRSRSVKFYVLEL